MAEKLYGLTEADLLFLKELKAEHLRRKTQGGSRGWFREDDPTAPECYVARTPSGGIPGLTEYTGTSPDEPGSAVCQIYNLRKSGGAGTGTGDDDYRLFRVPGVTRRVFNLTHFDLPESAWIVVHRTKYGAWVTDSPAEEAVTDDDTGTGTGTDVRDPDDYTGGGACSDLLRAGPNDCMIATGPDGQEVYLEGNGAGTWTSTEEMTYPGGSGILVLSWNSSTGLFDLTLDGAKLANCGNACYTGSWITGHVPIESGTAPEDACSQEVFTVCVGCTCCAVAGWEGEGWYCVQDDDTTGTGSDDCTPLYLTDADKCGVVICSGPYATEAEAIAICAFANDPNTFSCGAETYHWFDLMTLIIDTAPGSMPCISGAHIPTYWTGTVYNNEGSPGSPALGGGALPAGVAYTVGTNCHILVATSCSPFQLAVNLYNDAGVLQAVDAYGITSVTGDGTDAVEVTLESFGGGVARLIKAT